MGSSTAKPQTSPAKQLTVVDPYATGGTWYKGNLHVASVRGVGKDLPKALGDWYAAHGYAFLGISDMNTYTWPEEYGSRALPGVATVGATYPFADLLAIGIDHWLPAQTLQRAIDWIAADGGLPVLAAPLSPAKPQSLLAVMGLHGLYGLEVYDARLALGGAATGVSDPAIGGAWISVLAPSNDPSLLLSSLRRGAFVASTGAEFTDLMVAGSTITAEAAPGSSLRFIGRGGRLLQASEAIRQARWQLPYQPIGVPDNVSRIIGWVKEAGAIKEGLRQAANFANQAKASLQSFPDSTPRKTLSAIAQYIVTRTR